VADADRLETEDGLAGLIFWTNSDGMINKAHIWAAFAAPTNDQAVVNNALSFARLRGFLHQIDGDLSNSEIDSFLAESADALRSGQTQFSKVYGSQKISFEIFNAEGNVTLDVEPIQ